MKALTELTFDDIKKIKLLAFDVDGVTIKKGTDIEEEEKKESTTLTIKTHNLNPEILSKMLALKKHFVISIVSGRSLLYLTEVYYDLLWDKAALIGENGIFTLIDGEVMQVEKFDEATLQTMRNMFNDLKQLESKNKNFRAFEPKQFLITVHAWKDMPEVHEIVKKYDKSEQFYCIWNGEAFDIAPKKINKASGLANLAKHFGWTLENILCVGNGPNDKEMVEAVGIGVTTDKSQLDAGKFYTTKSLEYGGEELIDKLLELTS